MWSRPSDRACAKSRHTLPFQPHRHAGLNPMPRTVST